MKIYLENVMGLEQKTVLGSKQHKSRRYFDYFTSQIETTGVVAMYTEPLAWRVQLLCEAVPYHMHILIKRGN